MNVGIIGGGVAGLTAAYQLSRAGHKVAVFEKRPELGGQAGTFRVDSARLEVFYHHLFTNDTDVISLIDELGLSRNMVWLESKMGFFHGGRVYDFVTATDLLKFTPIGIIDRIRLGLVAMNLRRFKDWQKLEGITAEEWIKRHAGERNYEVVWGPLLRGKFGESAGEVGMVWFWGKIHLRFASRGQGGREKLGYMLGSFGQITDALAQRIAAAGGTLHTSTPVKRVLAEGGKVVGLEVEGKGKMAFDAVLATVPSPAFLNLAPALPEEYAAKLKQARYQAAVCLVLVMNKSLSRIYWLNISDPSIPFVAAIEHTNYINRSNYGGKHILYLSNYLSPSHRLYNATREQLLAEYLPHLKKINSQFDPSWVEQSHLFRDDAGQPIITTNYSARIPEHRTPLRGLYLANTTQIYPQDRGVNYSVRLGQTVAGLISDDAGKG
ncbi:MAG: NAD(P)/FAD-dependent oxidoreductase [Dehalococcoidia bacterium]|nr:NAD(P)/FAD-dependent oxidoreductase [Dehalococcoidia bacterium]